MPTRTATKRETKPRQPQQQQYHEAMNGFKRAFLDRTMISHRGNRTQAARALGLERTYLCKLLRDFGLSPHNPKKTETANP